MLDRLVYRNRSQHRSAKYFTLVLEVRAHVRVIGVGIPPQQMLMMIIVSTYCCSTQSCRMSRRSFLCSMSGHGDASLTGHPECAAFFRR